MMRFVAIILWRAEWRHGRSQDETKYSSSEHVIAQLLQIWFVCFVFSLDIDFVITRTFCDNIIMNVIVILSIAGIKVD